MYNYKAETNMYKKDSMALYTKQNIESVIVCLGGELQYHRSGDCV